MFRDLRGRFCRDNAGATAMVFALSVVPLAAIVGMAVDGARWYQARQVMSGAVDSALLAAARRLQMAPTEVDGALAAALQHYRVSVASKLKRKADTISFKVTDGGSAVTTDGSATINTTFLGVVGINELPIYTPAKAAKAMFGGGLNAGSDIEVALVLDFTASMCDSGEYCTSGTKVDGLKAAATELVNIVVQDDQTAYKSRVSLVPFTTRIRVAPDSHDGALMQKLTNLPLTWSGYTQDCSAWSYSGSGGGSGEANDGGTWTCTGAWTTTLKTGWQLMPCVTERIYTNRWDADDTLDYTDNPPSADRWLMGHGGDRWSYYENSLDVANPDPTGSMTAPTGTWNYASSPYCDEAPEENTVVPLSSDKAMLTSKLNSFVATGATAGPLATSFGWYMLSPNWSSIWPSTAEPGSYADVAAKTASGAPKLRKVAVIMSDGVYNTMRGNKGLDKVKVAQHARSLCQAMKTAGIEIFTVGFALDQLTGTDRSTAEDMLKDCGSDVRHFYSTLNVEQLKTAFQDIALRISPIRLTQ